MRDDKVTIAKAIGILLMVAVHGGMQKYGADFIVMFHMPLFFFVSGYCFKEKHLNYPPQFVKKRIKGLYKPYVKWSLIFLVLHNVFYYFGIYNNVYGFNGKVSHIYTLKETIRRAVDIMIGMHGNEQLLGGYWFLPQLLFASLLGFLMIKWIKNLYMGLALILFATIVSSYFNLHLPYFPVRSLTCLSTLFFLSGYVYKKKFDNWSSWRYTLSFAVIVALGSVFSYTTMLRYSASEVIPYSICAICGTVMTLNISSFIASKDNGLKRFLVYIGDNTMIVLTWHFLCFKIVSLAIIEYEDLPMTKLAYFPIIQDYNYLWPVYLLIGAGIPLTVKYIRIITDK